MLLFTLDARFGPAPFDPTSSHFSLVDKFASKFLESKLAHTKMSDEVRLRGVGLARL